MMTILVFFLKHKNFHRWSIFFKLKLPLAIRNIKQDWLNSSFNIYIEFHQNLNFKLIVNHRFGRFSWFLTWIRRLPFNHYLNLTIIFPIYFSALGESDKVKYFGKRKFSQVEYSVGLRLFLVMRNIKQDWLNPSFNICTEFH